MKDSFDDMGISTPILVAGFFGGLVRVLSRGATSFREIIASPVSGALCASYLTKPALHYANAVGISLPHTDMLNADNWILSAAFVVGICGMWVTDFILIQLGKFFKPLK